MADIETPRLRLRRWIDSDFEPLVAMNADPRVMEFLGGGRSREETKGIWSRAHSHFETYGFGRWAMEVDGMFAGWLGLTLPRFEADFTPCVEVGYRLRTEFQGRGLATEGARAVLQYGFERLNLNEIVAFTVPLNARSLRVMEKIGLTFSGEFDHPLIEKGDPLRRHVLYRISRTVWENGSSGKTTGVGTAALYAGPIHRPADGAREPPL